MSAFTVRAEAMPAWAALGAALEESTTPCQREPGPFFADTVEERVEAAQACAMCPVVTLCARFADINREAAGVWGGSDRTPQIERRPRRKVATC